MALRSKIQAFETGGVSNLTPNSKRKRSIYDAEVDQKIDLFESLKGQEEGYRRLGPMYRRFGNLKQKFEADLRSLHSNEEEDKENITNRSQPEATRPSTPKAKEAQCGLADELPDAVSVEEAAMNAARVAELEEMIRALYHKYNARKKQVHTLKKQKLDLESLVSAQRDEQKRHTELQQQSEEEIQRLQELNKFLSEGYEDVKEEMRKKAVLIRSKVLRDELRKELEDKRKLREEMREKQRASILNGDDHLEAEDDQQQLGASPQREEEHVKQAAARDEERKRMAEQLEAEIAERMRAEYEQREESLVNSRLAAVREELERETEARLARERAEWESRQAEVAQQNEEEAQRRQRESKRKREEEFNGLMGALRGDNTRLGREIEEKEEELQVLRSDVVALQEAIEHMQEEMTIEATEWERMKACLEKEVHRAYKELKSKEEKEAELQGEIRGLRDELQRALALAQQQPGADENECQYCGGGKRRKVDSNGDNREVEVEREAVTEQTEEIEKKAIKTTGRAAAPVATAGKETTPIRTPVRTAQIKRPASMVVGKRPSEAKTQPESDKGMATKEAKEEKAAKRRSQVNTSVGTPRPATTKLSSRATLAGREKIASLSSSSSATATPSSSSSSASPLRRASIAPTTPRKGSVREKSAASSIASSSSSVATASPRRRERASSVFASQTPRFDTKVDPLRYEKLAGLGGSSGNSDNTTQ